MATNYTVFYDDVMPFCPGAPLVLAQQEIRAAAIEFFAKSLCYQIQLTPFNAVNNQADYTLTSQITTTAIEQVLEVTYNNGAPLRFVRRIRDLHAAYGPGWDAVAAGTPLYAYVNPQATSVKLQPKPNGTSSIAVLAAIKPTHASTAIQDDDLYQQHRLVISEGAKWRMLKMPKKPWTNMELAAQCEKLFNEGIKAALIKTTAGHGQNTGLTRGAAMEARKE